MNTTYLDILFQRLGWIGGRNLLFLSEDWGCLIFITVRLQNENTCWVKKNGLTPLLIPEEWTRSWRFSSCFRGSLGKSCSFSTLYYTPVRRDEPVQMDGMIAPFSFSADWARLRRSKERAKEKKKRAAAKRKKERDWGERETDRESEREKDRTANVS